MDKINLRKDIRAGISVQRPDREYWNIMKGIGIICVVIGHSWMQMQNFVYAFHMPLFFFISGYLYDEEKYGDQPFVYISRRIRSVWIKYMVWEAVFILFHNFFYRIGMLYGVGIESYEYSKREIVLELAEAVLGCANELLIGALWFAPALVLAVSGMSLIIAVSRKLEILTGGILVKFFFQFICVMVLGAIGYILIMSHQDFPAFMHISMAVMPYLWLGYLLRNYVRDFTQYVNGFVALAALIVVIIVSRRYLISLVNNYVYPFMYLLAVLGIYACLYLAKILKKNNLFSTIFSLLGKESFFLMATHLFVLRLIDRIYSMRYGEEWILYYVKLPVAFDELVPLYLVMGIGVPTIIWCLSKKVKNIGRYAKN